MNSREVGVARRNTPGAMRMASPAMSMKYPINGTCQTLSSIVVTG